MENVATSAEGLTHTESPRPFGTSTPGLSDLPVQLREGLSLEESRDLQDLLHCLWLAEGAYKVVDHGPELATELTATLSQGFPAELLALQEVSWSLPSVNHRYLLSESKDTLYVAFMGTKQRRDLVANASVMQAPIWPLDYADQAPAKAGPAAHAGFLSRTAEVPVESLFAHACRTKKQLIFTGHSLGAAVAVLSTIKLLKQLPAGSQPQLACIIFACPAVGNAALADLVAASGWSGYFRNHLIPEDIVPRLLAPPEGMATGAALHLQQAAAAAAAGEPCLPRLRLPSIARPSFGGRKRRRSGSPAPHRKQHRQHPPSADGHACIDDRKPRAPSHCSERDRQAINCAAPEAQHGRMCSKSGANASGMDGATAPEAAGGAGSGMARWPSIGGQAAAAEGKGQLHQSQQQQTEIGIWHRGRRRSWAFQPPSLQESMPAMQAAAGNAASMAQAAPKRAMAALREHAANQHLHVHAAPHDGLPASAPAAVLAVAEQVSRAVAMRSAGASLAAASGRSSTASKASGNASLYDEDVTSLLLGLTAEERASLAGRNAPAASSEGSMPAEMATPAAALPPKPTSSPASEPDLRTSSAAAASSTPQQPYTARGSKSPRLSDKLPAAELARSLIPASIEPPAAAASSKPRAGQLANSGVQLISRTAGAGVRSASAGVRSAARFMGTPITAARRQYFPIGRHLYIFPWAVAPVAADTAMLSSAPLQAVAEASQAEVRAGTDPSEVRNPLKRAAAMHRMAYHRLRLRGIINKAVQGLTAGQLQDLMAACVRQRPSTWVSHPEPRLVLGDLSPPMHPRRAEAFLPWQLPGRADVRQMLDDLGSLSEQGIASESSSREPERFRWLHPWAWVSGLSWRGHKATPYADITVQVSGSGLENCRHVQVLVPDSPPCRATLLHKPSALPPATAYTLLGSRQPQVLRQAALAGLWTMRLLRRSVAALDRSNASGIEDSLLVRAQVPQQALQQAGEAFMETGHSECTSLKIVLQSDFKEYSLPLHLHSGASWLISDLTQSSKSMLDWLAPWAS